MDFDKLSLEIIKAIRSNRSQNELSMKLGYEFNQYHRWESGIKKFNWDDLINTCKVQKIALKEIFVKEFYFKGSLKASSVLKHVLGDNDLNQVSKSLKIPLKKIKDFLSDKQVPPLSFMLQAIYRYMGLHFFKLIYQMTDPRQLPELSDYIFMADEYFKTTMERPYLFGVPKCLEMEEYVSLKEHEKNFIASKMGLTEEEENEAIKYLSELGLIIMEKGKWVNKMSSNIYPFSDLKLDPRFTKKYWFNKAIKRIENPPKKEGILSGKSTVSIMFLGDEALEKLEHLTSKYIANINEVPEQQDRDEKNIRVVCLSIFDPSTDA